MELRRRLQARMEELRRKRSADQTAAAKDWRKKQQGQQQGQGQGQGQHMTGERQRKKAEQKQQQQQRHQLGGKKEDVGGEAQAAPEAEAAAQVGRSLGACRRELIYHARAVYNSNEEENCTGA